MTCSSATGRKMMRIKAIYSLLNDGFIHFNNKIDGKIGCGGYMNGVDDGRKW
jgi:hypothetical protein